MVSQSKKHSMTKMVKIYTPFQTQTAQKSYSLGPYIAIYRAHVREYPQDSDTFRVVFQNLPTGIPVADTFSLSPLGRGGVRECSQ